LGGQSIATTPHALHDLALLTRRSLSRQRFVATDSVSP
jgi:hypothetical protein